MENRKHHFRVVQLLWEILIEEFAVPTFQAVSNDEVAQPILSPDSIDDLHEPVSNLQTIMKERYIFDFIELNVRYHISLEKEQVAISFSENFQKLLIQD